MNKKIGMLLPKSVLYPSMAFDIVAGLKAGFENVGLNGVEVRTENIGLGTDDKLIYAVCEKMLMDDVNVIAGYVNPRTAEKLEPLFASANGIFIALDAGYHFPTTTNKFPHIFYVSLQGALCMSVAARIAIEEGKKSIAYLSSFYDSGYRSAFAVHKTVERSDGKIVFNLITPLKRSDLTLQPLEDYRNETHVDAVFAAFCGDMLLDLFTAAAGGNAFKDIPVYGSPFVGEEYWLSKSPYPGADVTVCVPWASGLDNPANKQFLEKLTHKKANLFSILAWDAAVVAAKAMSADDAESAIPVLEGYSFTSPRGTVTLDAPTHLCYAPVYSAVVKKDESTGNCRLEPGAESPYTGDQRVVLENDINTITGSMTSWHNTYPCLDS